MPQFAYLECARCGHRISAESLETSCPVDAGLLYVRYDMDALRNTTNRDRPAAVVAASSESLGMWRYADVLPDAVPVTLGEGWTPIRQGRRFSGLYIKDEGSNPTGTVEARGFSLAVTMAKYRGLKQVSFAGENAGTLAAYAAAGKIAAHVVLPQNVSLAEYAEAVVYRANIVPESAASAEGSSLDLSSPLHPFRVEGLKTLGYELVEQFGWENPAAVLYPAAESAGLVAMWKAFDEMEALGWVSGKRPRMYASHTSNQHALESGVESLTLDIVRESGGSLIASDEAEVTATLLDWGREEGLFLCPEGAAAASGYTKLLASGEIKAGERVVLFNTSAAVRHVDALSRALYLRRPGSLPKSLPVGGIITPV